MKFPGIPVGNRGRAIAGNSRSHWMQYSYS